MKAAVTLRPGPPEVMEIQERPQPTAKEGWVFIQVKAFGLNRSELFTRQGHSPGVQFPRIQMFQTVSGSLRQALEVKKGETLLIRLEG